MLGSDLGPNCLQKLSANNTNRQRNCATCSSGNQKFICNLEPMCYTVKPVLRGHLKIDKTRVLMENGGLMKVESYAFKLH